VKNAACAPPNRHCEEPFDAACGVAQDELPLGGSDAAIQPGVSDTLSTGLLRFARNDGRGGGTDITAFHPLGSQLSLG
jgi:hypothetical protein